jgi:hypothetical protein
VVSIFTLLGYGLSDLLIAYLTGGRSVRCTSLWVLSSILSYTLLFGAGDRLEGFEGTQYFPLVFFDTASFTRTWLPPNFPLYHLFSGIRRGGIFGSVYIREIGRAQYTSTTIAHSPKAQR